MTSLVVKTIEELSSEASHEIGESQANLYLARKQVREIISETFPELRLPPDGDDLIDRCLRCRKFDVASAAALVNNFYKLLLEVYVLVRNDASYFLPSTHNKVFYGPLGYAVCRHRDHLGRAVTVINYDKMPAKIFSVNQAIAAGILLVLELTKSVDIQRIGAVFVFNVAGFEFGHAKQFRTGIMKVIARAMQGTFPVRIKGLYAVNCTKIMSVMYAMIRPFLGEKMRNRVHMYGSDLTTFHRQVSPDILPHFLGGNLPDNEFADAEFSRRLVSTDDYYAGSVLKHELMNYGYMETGTDKSKSGDETG